MARALPIGRTKQAALDAAQSRSRGVSAIVRARARERLCEREGARAPYLLADGVMYDERRVNSWRLLASYSCLSHVKDGER